MEKKVVNEFKITPIEIEELLFHDWMEKYSTKKPLVAALLVIFCLVAYTVISKNEAMIFVIAILVLVVALGFPTVLLICALVKRSKNKKALISFRERYGQEPLIRIEIENQIKCTIGNDIFITDFNNIDKTFESEHLYILHTKDNQSIPISKHGFIAGEYQDFIFLFQGIKKS